MKFSSSSTFLAFAITYATFSSTISASEVDPPPQVCAYDNRTCEGGDCWCADLERDAAICGKSDSAPPKNCKYVHKMKDSDEELVRDEAICGRKGTNETEPPSDESYNPHEYYTGWRFGINSAGTFGLWKPNGDLVKACASYQDSFVVGENFIKSMSEDDEGDTKTGLSVMCEAGNGDGASGTKLTLKSGRDPLIQLEPRD